MLFIYYFNKLTEILMDNKIKKTIIIISILCNNSKNSMSM